MSTRLVLAKVFAAGSTGIFSGAALYISLCQHPALLEVQDVTFQAPFFRRMYYYAARLQAPLSLLSGISSIIVFGMEKNHTKAMPKVWLSAAITMFSIAPYTILCMLQLNRQLCDTIQCKERGNTWMTWMLKRWGRMHGLRTILSVTAFSGILVALAFAGSDEGSIEHTTSPSSSSSNSPQLTIAPAPAPPTSASHANILIR
jgi:hypothetical protein